jgi:hypothetical protein
MELLGQAHRNDDGVGFCLFVVVVAIVVVVSLLVALGQRASWRQTLGRVATHLHGRLQPGNLFQNYDRVHFQHADQAAELRFSREGKRRRYTHVEISWSGPPLRCEVYPEGFLASVRKLLGMEDIVIGSPLFDWQFIITGDDPAAVKSLLNAQVQALIFDLNKYVHGLHVRFSSRSLTVTCSSHLSDFARLVEIIRQCRDLYEAALATMGQGIEFLDGALSMRATASSSARCMVCGEGLDSDVVHCRSCRTPHHRECWSYSGGCSTYGCREKTFVR